MQNTTFTRLRKYLNGDPEKLCISGRKNNIRESKLDNYKDTIAQFLSRRVLHCCIPLLKSIEKAASAISALLLMG